MILSDKQRLEHTIKQYDKYLSSICNKYQGIKL